MRTPLSGASSRLRLLASTMGPPAHDPEKLQTFRTKSCAIPKSIKRVPNSSRLMHAVTNKASGGEASLFTPSFSVLAGKPRHITGHQIDFQVDRIASTQGREGGDGEGVR